MMRTAFLEDLAAAGVAPEALDSDPAHARATRHAFCQRYADTAVTVLGTHFHHPTAGRIVRHDAGWRFQVDTP
jgi:hypothetical protein